MTNPVIVRDACIAGRYRLTARIAGGGMGEVWRGRDERLQRAIAVKLLRPEHADSAEFRARLRVEARAAASITSERVVAVYDWGEECDDDGRWMSFIVMELIDGETVSTLLAREYTLAPRHVARLIQDVATALMHAHSCGVVHRDIKPANLLIGRDGRVKVADFGIARAQDATRLTATGALLGTATYLSPEQVHGHSLTPATDIFSLGVVAYQCLSGQPPFVADGEIATALARLQHSAPPLPATVPLGIAELVTGMLAEDPDLRPSAAVISQSALAPETDVAPTRVLPVGALAGTTRLMRSTLGGRRHGSRRSVALATITGLVLLAGVALALSGAFGHSGTLGGSGAQTPAPHVAASSTANTPTSLAHARTATKSSASAVVVPATSTVHGPGHVPPGHAKAHGPKNKHGHGPPGPGPGPGSGAKGK
jgi:serine/threonine protein kinase